MQSAKFRIYFSDFYGATAEQVEKHGAFNISLINDLPLFIDPFLLFNSDKPEYQRLHEQIVAYVKFLKVQSEKQLPDGLVRAWFHFPEIKQNWLGYSKIGNEGRGLGAQFARALKTNLSSVFRDFGEEDDVGAHLEKLTLIRGGVGKDQISDFTCNLISGYLAAYTEAFSKRYIDPKLLRKFNVPKIEFNWKTKTWGAKEFLLPRFGKDYVLLTPIDMLTKDESWINHRNFVEDFSGVLASVSNGQIRAEIDRYFLSVLPVRPKQEQLEQAIEKVVKKFPKILDYYIAEKERDKKGASRVSAEKVQEAHALFVEQLKRLVELLDDKTKFYKTGANSYEEGMARVHFLKQVIEDQDGYRYFYIKGKAVRRESDLQIMFKLTWFASMFDSNAEVNNGRGPADFIVSYGSKDKAVIEFKLASNRKIEGNLKAQAEIYSKAARATHPPIKVILYFTADERGRIDDLLHKYKLEKCKEIVLIDATSGKASASRA